MQVGKTATGLLTFGDGTVLAMGYDSVGVAHPVFLGTSTVSTRSPKFVFTHWDRRLLNFGVTAGSQPAIWVHDGSATAANHMELYHDGTDGKITTAAGDLDLNPAGDVWVKNGWSGTFTNGDGATVTVLNGIITGVA